MSEITVTKVIELYLADLKARVAADSYSARSYDNLSVRLRQFSEMFGPQTIDQCRQHDITAFLAAHPSWKAVHTKRMATGAVVTAFGWACDEEIIGRNPYRRPRSLRGQRGGVRRPATVAEYCALMRHTSSRQLRRILFFLRRTGARTCEARELTWDQVYLDGPVPFISLRRHKSFHKTHEPRRIGLDPATANFLRNLRRQAMSDTPVVWDAPPADSPELLCKKCGRTRRLSDFSNVVRNPGTPSAVTYRRSWCKICCREYQKWRGTLRRKREACSVKGNGDAFLTWRNVSTPRRLPAIREKWHPGQHVFMKPSGEPWGDRRALGQHFRAAARRIGLDKDVADRVSAYALRHLFTVHALEAGIPIRSLADALGHASTNLIDACYGSHTRSKIEHLNNVAADIIRSRRKGNA